MHDVKENLTKCFSTVFPELSPEEIVAASPNTVGAWDSLSAVTLMALIEEEFGIRLEPDGKLDNMSFENLLPRITEAVSQTPAGTVHL
jgi:acyl carrier protein